MLNRNFRITEPSTLVWRLLGNFFERKVRRIHLSQLGTLDSRQELTFSRRFEEILTAFCNGFRAEERSKTTVDLVGFHIEGEAMRLALSSSLFHAPSDLEGLLAEQNHYRYTIHVGVGWAWARLSRAQKVTNSSLDPLLRWLAYDGWGFHDGLFYTGQHRTQMSAPKQLTGYSRRAWDQGFGRSLWFVASGDPERIAFTIQAFDKERKGDLWSGIGLAIGYAGGSDAESLTELRILSNEYLPEMAQGLCFAAKARVESKCIPPHTLLACERILRIDAQTAAEITDEVLPTEVKDCESFPAFETWRLNIQWRLRSMLQVTSFES